MEKTGITFIATGDELLCGHVINTATPWMANLLHKQGYHCNEHRVTSDLQSDISNAITDAVKNNRIVIVCGGLGPTVDDRTRFALADACNVTLSFNESVWAAIKARLTSYNLSVPDNNRTQAMLPEDGLVIENKNGTAAGCMYDYEGSTICLLPGPPGESKPMFLDVVLPFILDTMPAAWPLSHVFLLFGASEGHLATQCEPLITTTDLNLGFRFEYPYLELKLFGKSHVEETYEQTKAALESIVSSYCVGGVPLSTQLYTQLLESEHTFHLDDQATGGRLLSMLLNPQSNHLMTHDSHDCGYKIKVRGLEDYWLRKEADEYLITFELAINNRVVNLVTKKIPARGDRSLPYACEWLCSQWLDSLLKI